MPAPVLFAPPEFVPEFVELAPPKFVELAAAEFV
jgi:hypothetical protein